MGILSDRLITIEPWLHDSPDDQINDDASPEMGQLNRAVATAFLDWRWAMPTSFKATSLPTHAVEQPMLDANEAPEWWSVEEGSSFVEFDGFLIDRQTAVAACGGLSAPIAA